MKKFIVSLVTAVFAVIITYYVGMFLNTFHLWLFRASAEGDPGARNDLLSFRVNSDSNLGLIVIIASWSTIFIVTYVIVKIVLEKVLLK